MSESDAEAPLCGSAAELVAFWDGLAARLRQLRGATPLSVEAAARAVSIRRVELEWFESGERRPSLGKLRRLLPLYGAGVVDVLTGVAMDVRPGLGAQFDPLAEALMLFCGVTPEHMAGGSLGTDSGGTIAGVGSEVSGRRQDNPHRVNVTVSMRRAYEDGASVREVARQHGVAFGTARSMLIEAGTQMRSTGRPRRHTGRLPGGSG